jgi:hypothetical protein
LHNLMTGLPLIDLPKDVIFRLLDRGDVPPPSEDLPPDAREVIRELTAGDPALRPADAHAASLRLRSLIGDPVAARDKLAERVSAWRAKMLGAQTAETAILTGPVGALPDDDVDDTKPQAVPRRR